MANDLAALIGEALPDLSDSERLQVLKHMRSKAEIAMAAAGGQAPVIEYEIRNRRVEFQPTTEWLDSLDTVITRVEARVNAASSGGGTVRNRLVLMRRP